jgi:hypothetical protein
MKTNVNVYLAALFLEWEMFQARFVEKSEHFKFNYFFYEKSVVYEITWKKLLYSQAGNRRQYNTAHTLWMLDSYG